MRERKVRGYQSPRELIDEIRDERRFRGFRPVEELALDYADLSVRLGYLATLDMLQAGKASELTRDHVTLDYQLDAEVAGRILRLVQYDMEILEVL